MKYYVSKYGDKIKAGETNPEAGLPMQNNWESFWTEHDTEDAAKAFIIERAKKTS